MTAIGDALAAAGYAAARRDWRSVSLRYRARNRDLFAFEDSNPEVESLYRKLHLPTWIVNVQVRSPARPNLRHQLQYSVQAENGASAIERAKYLVAQDGHTYVALVSARKAPGT